VYLETGSREMGCDMFIYLMNMGCLVLFGINDFHGRGESKRDEESKKYTAVGYETTIIRYLDIQFQREFDYNRKKNNPIEMGGVVL